MSMIPVMGCQICCIFWLVTLFAIKLSRSQPGKQKALAEPMKVEGFNISEISSKPKSFLIGKKEFLPFSTTDLSVSGIAFSQLFLMYKIASVQKKFEHFNTSRWNYRFHAKNVAGKVTLEMQEDLILILATKDNTVTDNFQVQICYALGEVPCVSRQANAINGENFNLKHIGKKNQKGRRHFMVKIGDASVLKLVSNNNSKITGANGAIVFKLVMDRASLQSSVGLNCICEEYNIKDFSSTYENIRKAAAVTFVVLQTHVESQPPSN